MEQLRCHVWCWFLSCDASRSRSLARGSVHGGSRWCGGVRAVSSPRQVAILIPFRNRYEHLPVLFRHLIPMLQRQRLQFAFYVVEQVSEPGAQLLGADVRR